MIADLCYGILLNHDRFIEFRVFMGTSTDIQCDKGYLGQSL